MSLLIAAAITFLACFLLVPVIFAHSLQWASCLESPNLSIDCKFLHVAQPPHLPLR